MHRVRLLILVLVTAGFGADVFAQATGEIPDVFEGVGIEEHLGDRIPLELIFADEAGEPVELSRFFDGERPVLLNLVYFECPMLCSLLLTEFTKTLKELEWTPGDQFDIVTVSFSASEIPDQARVAEERFVGQLGREGAGEGWHFLTGDSTAIAGLAEAVGFGFKWIESSQEFAHPAVLTFLSGEGVITRYIHGMAYQPGDVRKALVEASEGKVGSTIDRILLYCYRYDEVENAYVLHAQNLMKLGGLLTLLLLGLALFIFWRRERQRLHPAIV